MPMLFSYGTLQDADVQRATFGRLLHGRPDELIGFEPSQVRIDDPQLAAAVGRTHHANVVVGRHDGRVPGSVFDVSEAELALADEYERPASYERIIVALASGIEAWVYVHAPRSTDRA
jgi:gamma-glutamylcyclotransferase (GGCT)/AIG2-like uncharacterized protein YtfP